MGAALFPGGLGGGLGHSGRDGGPPVTALIQVPSAVYVSDATWEEVRPRLEHLAAQLRMAVEAVNRAT